MVTRLILRSANSFRVCLKASNSYKYNCRFSLDNYLTIKRIGGYVPSILFIFCFYHTYTDITGNTQRLGGNKIYGEKYFRSISAQYHGKAGEIYWRDDGYREAIEREKEAAERLKETLTEEQMAMVEQYHIAISATMGICELLAYKQGMKDMVSILK